jgi:hypothetical protein
MWNDTVCITQTLQWKITVSCSYSENFVFIRTIPVDVKVHTTADEISWP